MLLPLKWQKLFLIWNVEQMKNPINGTVPPHQGRQLPHNWAAMAGARAVQADAAYINALENSWRQPLGKQVANPGRDARLTNDSHGRSDRVDSQLRLIGEDGDWQVWRDEHGTTVRRRK
jgi:hypothetical protein